MHERATRHEVERVVPGLLEQRPDRVAEHDECVEIDGMRESIEQRDGELLGGWIAGRASDAVERSVDKRGARLDRRDAIRDRASEVVVRVKSDLDLRGAEHARHVSLHFVGLHPTGRVDDVEPIETVTCRTLRELADFRRRFRVRLHHIDRGDHAAVLDLANVGEQIVVDLVRHHREPNERELQICDPVDVVDRRESLSGRQHDADLCTLCDA